jgi:ATP-dependent RNA helicase DDX27
MLPILERLHYKPKADVATRVLVLVPTRELGAQVCAVTKDLLKVLSTESRVFGCFMVA